jgi:hypothetical protein
MPLANGYGVRGREQPLRQGVFTHLSAGRTQHLIQAVLAEQIEVGRINVVLNIELPADRPAAVPAVPYTFEPGAIKLRGALRARLPTANAPVIHDQAGEGHGGDEQPWQRNRVGSEAQPRRDQKRHAEGEPGIPEASM